MKAYDENGDRPERRSFGWDQAEPCQEAAYEHACCRSSRRARRSVARGLWHEPARPRAERRRHRRRRGRTSRRGGGSSLGRRSPGRRGRRRYRRLHQSQPGRSRQAGLEVACRATDSARTEQGPPATRDARPWATASCAMSARTPRSSATTRTPSRWISRGRSDASGADGATETDIEIGLHRPEDRQHGKIEIGVDQPDPRVNPGGVRRAGADIVAGSANTARIHSWVGLVNAYFDFPVLTIFGPMEPYLDVGLGAAISS